MRADTVAWWPPLWRLVRPIPLAWIRTGSWALCSGNGMATARLLIRVESWLLWRRAPRSMFRRCSVPARSLPHRLRDFRSFRASRRPPEIQQALSLGVTWVKGFPAIALGAEWFTASAAASAAADGGSRRAQCVQRPPVPRFGGHCVGVGSALSDPDPARTARRTRPFTMVRVLLRVLISRGGGHHVRPTDTRRR